MKNDGVWSMPEEQCRNCVSLHNYSDDIECKYTIRGCSFISDCPCGQCFLKIICHIPCDKLISHKDMNINSHYIEEAIRKGEHIN